MAQGTTTINFGSFPGSSDTSVDVTGQTGITGSSLVEAWIYPVATADHSADEHMVETVKAVAGNVVAGTGFTVYGFNTSEIREPLLSAEPSTRNLAMPQHYAQAGGRAPRLYGQFTVAWVWN
jgi:hypothetical protein